MFPPDKGYFFFNELKYYQEIYKGSKFKPNEKFYNIHSPFVMDSEFLSSKLSKNKKSNKRKKISTANINNDWLKEKSLFVEKIWIKYVESIKKNDYVPLDNNVEARTLVANAPEFKIQAAVDTSSLGVCQFPTKNQNLPSKDSEATLNKNDNEDFYELFYNSFCYLIPPQSGFILSDVNIVKHFINFGMKFDLIVMDPPWANKSVKRKKVYDWFDMNDLSSLPVFDILADNGVIAIWLTNNKSVHTKLETILEKWNLKEITKWYWLKITTTGKPVYSFTPNHKVPFESLAFACRPDTLNLFKRKIIDDFCIIRCDFAVCLNVFSVPNATHSRKPPIGSILKELNIFKCEQCLELYARYLIPNTISIGYESIKFQDSYYFDKK